MAESDGAKRRAVEPLDPDTLEERLRTATHTLFPDRIAKTMMLAPHSNPQATNPTLRRTNYFVWKNGFTDLSTGRM